MKFSNRLWQIRVRFAPSPTGHLHIGGLRTALFNYLFAKSNGGQFILRIEDTDRTRFVAEAQDKIYESLLTYGIKPDEGPREGGDYGSYEQSKRAGLYQDAAERLIGSGAAYRCFCSEERLELLRKNAARSGTIPKYDRKCSHLDRDEARRMANAGRQHVVRFKLDKQNVAFNDEIYGDVNQTIDESDAVLLKSDGMPTYHLANVVDDKHMRISHVIRGMEWLSSTGKHHLLYKAFGWSPPVFAHLPLIMRTATKKLSKRDKDAFVGYYGDELGVLPDAVLNLLIRNGSGIKDFDANHLYSMEEMIHNFDIHLIGRRNLLLDSDVLAKYSRMAFRENNFDKIIKPMIIQRLKKDLNFEPSDVPEDSYIRNVYEFLKEKEETFGNLSSLSRGDFVWLFTRPKSSELLCSYHCSDNLDSILQDLQCLDEWSVSNVQKLAKKHELSNAKMMGICRISLIGTKKGPPISELIEFFGSNECRDRIKRMREYVKNEMSNKEKPI